MKSWLVNLSIRGKLGLIILVVSGLLLSLISIALITNEYLRLKRNLADDLTALTAIMATNSRIGLAFNDETVAREVLKSLKAKPTIMWAHIFDPRGGFFAGYVHPDLAASQAATPQVEDYRAVEFIGLDASGELNIQDGFAFHASHGHALAFQRITLDNRFLGGMVIQSNLEEFRQRLNWYMGTLFGVMLISLLLSLLLANRMQRLLTAPVYHLRDAMRRVSEEKNYRLRVEKSSNDEIGQLMDGFNGMLAKIQDSDQEIRSLNAQLRQENQRLGAELEVTRKLQQMVLPTPEELAGFPGLDIAAHMEPAEEVGGDYYDVLIHGEKIKIGMGDVTGHGLESGVVMLMVQTAVRTLLAHGVNEAADFFHALNQVVFGNVKRMRGDKNLTLALLDYQAGEVVLSGQHEEVLICRARGQIERLDTIDLGFMVGLVPDIRRFIAEARLYLEIGDGLVLYTDGITEARNLDEQLYGVERLCQVIGENWQLDANQIREQVISDLRSFVGSQKLLDDISLLILKRVA